MRFIAAALVFAYHIRWASGLFASTGAADRYAAVFGRAGLVGVGFFFVLSGFVLTWSARPGDTAPRFWRRRAAKIGPNHLVTFAAALLLLDAVGASITRTPTVLSGLLLQAWVPHMDTIFAANSVSWSLSCEAFFYLLFPFLLRGIDRIRPERLWAWAGALVAVVFVIPLLSAAVPDSPTIPFPNTSVPRMWFVYILPATRLLDFAFGMMLARIVRAGRALPVSLGGAVALAVAVYTAEPLFPVTYQMTALMLVPLGLVIAAGAASDAAGRRTVMSGPVAVWLGEISFAFYMVHFLVIVYGHHYLGHPNGYSTPVAAAIAVGMLAASVLIAALLYTVVERPFLRRFGTSRRRLSDDVAAALDLTTPEGDNPVSRALQGS
jgi:mycarose O-acyltransferase